MCHPLPPGCPSCAAAEAQCNRMATQIQESERDVSSLLSFLARIREALGDHGERTQTDLLDSAAPCMRRQTPPRWTAWKT